jgi:carboxyl-terminal processing protease
MIDIMKRNYKLLLLVLLLAFASCSFTSKTFEDPDKDKLLIRLISYVLEEGHYSPKDFNDAFSEQVFEGYLKQLDPFKRYFYESDIKDFEKYKDKLDDQIKEDNITFFNLTHERLLQRIEESKAIYKEVLSAPFDFSIKEEFFTDYDNLSYVKSKKEMKERWRQQLKFSTIANYDDLIAQQDDTYNDKKTLENVSDLDPDRFDTKEQESKSDEIKSLVQLEQEARDVSLRSLNELYDFIEERERKDWFAVYVNAIVEEFDPHTFYFAPEDKDRFDVEMSGNFEGIGARLQKRMDAILVNEIISGGPAWRQNELEVGDQILKVRQENEKESTNIVGMRLDDAIKLIKGPKGTKVILTLKKVDGNIEDLMLPPEVCAVYEP